ncbi:hypothetical protein DUNSADRAFT_10669 [Dunaliella salina]|uniref:Encoded protein n=1 Tax=Dunaliella salina TaxID=3046 RepID=A0ABQ7GF11_DUNSA|nr:hypothetical protein DUNSADRAFT_10669 [Dunaliella salina]|eukprot:KAF5833119.1 hypothetical protein DUNSADRAFT_10669 [Dunaliella salina]
MQEADAPCFSHRAGCLQETPGRKKLMHPVSGARDRGDHGTGESSVPDPSMRASLTMSPSSLPLVQSPAMGPGVCAASHLHDPYSDMRHNAAWHQGSLNSSDWGSNCLQGRLGPFGMKRSARKGIAGEPLLAVGADGVPVRWANHNNVRDVSGM